VTDDYANRQLHYIRDQLEQAAECTENAGKAAHDLFMAAKMPSRQASARAVLEAHAGQANQHARIALDCIADSRP
jgi:hypothetical protein